MRKAINLVLTTGVAAVICYFSLAKFSPGTGSSGSSLMTTLHVIAYAGLAGSAMLYLQDTERNELEAFMFAAFFGLALELIQGRTGYRYFSLADIAANSLGASTIFLNKQIRLAEKVVEMESRILEMLL